MGSVRLPCSHRGILCPDGFSSLPITPVLGPRLNVACLGGASAEPLDKASCPSTRAPGVPVSYLSSLPLADGGVQAVSALTPSTRLRRAE